jgi:hypothetical protein
MIEYLLLLFSNPYMETLTLNLTILKYFGKVIRSWGWSPYNEISAFIRRERRVIAGFFLSPQAGEKTRK